MKLELKNLSDKILVAVCYVITIELAVAIALAINFMYDYHFYTSDRDTYPIQKAMSQKTQTECDSIAEYASLVYAQRDGGNLGHEVQSVYDTYRKKYEPANTNLVFFVSDESGTVFLQNDSGFDRNDYCYTRTKSVKLFSGAEANIALYVRNRMTAHDDYSLTVNLIRTATAMRFVLFAVLFVLICLAIFLMGILMFSVGRSQNSTRSILLMEKVPLDLFTLCIAVLIGFGLTLILLSSVAGIKETSIVLWNAVILIVVLFNSLFILLYGLSLALRVKEGHVLRNTLIYKLISKLRAKKKVEKERSFTVPFIGKALITIGVVMVGELASIFYFVYKYKTCESGQLEDFNFLFFAFAQLACVFIIGSIFSLIVLNLNTIRESGKKIAAGDYDAVADSHIMFGDFKAINDDLISIKDEMIGALEAKNRSQDLRNEIVTSISHDIKTPLTSIVNYADIIGSGNCTEEEIKSYSAIIQKQSERLKDLLRGLIDVSRISTGTIEINLEPTDLSLLIQQCAEEFIYRFEEKKLRLEFNVPANGVMISADGSKLWRIFENLFGNICKYAMSGTRVFVKLTEAEDKVTVEVKNITAQPITVPPEELLLRFTQNDSSRHTEGHGLGLSIAKSFTELQNGTFELEVDGDVFKVLLSFQKV